MKKGKRKKDTAPTQSTSQDSSSEWIEPAPCKRCNSIGLLILSVTRDDDGRKVKYTEAGRCTCGWGKRFPSMPFYDELPGTSPEDDYESLYVAELKHWHGEDTARRYQQLRNEYVARAKAGKGNQNAAQALGDLKEIFKGKDVNDDQHANNDDPKRGLDSSVPF